LNICVKTCVACLFLGLFLFSCKSQTGENEISLKGAELSIDISHLQQRVPEFYVLPYSGKKIRFFLVLMDGDVRSYLNACHDCYPRRMGFRFEGDRVICRSCNVGYPLDALKSGIGGCYPIHLNGHLVHGRYVIDSKSLLDARKYF